MLRVIFEPEHLGVLNEELALVPPERLVHVVGRQLLDGSLLVTELLLDIEADAGHVSVRASQQCQSKLNDIERLTGDHLIGVIHSHPRFHPEPSGQDAVATADLLAINSHLFAAVLGVVTDRHAAVPAGGHVLALPDGQLSLHFMDRDDLDQLRPAQPRPVDDSTLFMRAVGARQPRAETLALSGRRVLVIGVGSLGSNIAEQLVRNGVCGLDIIDDDVVEAVNLTRSTYTTADIGRPKVQALEERLLSINPALSIVGSQHRIGDESAKLLADQIGRSDLVVAVTDDPRAQGLVDSLLFRTGKPGVFGAVYRGGHAGEICFVVPGLTACYRCTVAPRMGAGLLPGVDYSTGRIRGAVALGADVATIAAMTARLALATMGVAYGEDNWLAGPLTEGRTMVQVGMEPTFFDSFGVFDDTPAQHTWQSLWIRPEGGDDCPDCNAPVARQSTSPLLVTNRRSRAPHAQVSRRGKRPRSIPDRSQSLRRHSRAIDRQGTSRRTRRQASRR